MRTKSAGATVTSDMVVSLSGFARAPTTSKERPGFWRRPFLSSVSRAGRSFITKPHMLTHAQGARFHTLIARSRHPSPCREDEPARGSCTFFWITRFRPRAIGRVVALLGEPIAGGLGQLERDLPILDELAQTAHLDIDNRAHIRAASDAGTAQSRRCGSGIPAGTPPATLPSPRRALHPRPPPRQGSRDTPRRDWRS